ncbi:MAG: hypothetical protein L6Q33_00395 [Bacteriovoracaceae bacterium]|nr:hypothetical protein [Bacteriovoracaceae bacterium]
MFRAFFVCSQDLVVKKKLFKEKSKLTELFDCSPVGELTSPGGEHSNIAELL